MAISVPKKTKREEIILQGEMSHSHMRAFK